MEDFPKNHRCKKGNGYRWQTNLQRRQACRGNRRNRQAKSHEDNRILQ